jgi:hypothetical protein
MVRAAQTAGRPLQLQFSTTKTHLESWHLVRAKASVRAQAAKVHPCMMTSLVPPYGHHATY